MCVLVNLWTIAEYHVKLWLSDMKKVYDDLIIINLYNSSESADSKERFGDQMTNIASG